MRWLLPVLMLVLAGCAGTGSEPTDAMPDDAGPSGASADADEPRDAQGTDPGGEGNGSVVTLVDDTYQWHLDDVDDVPAGVLQDPAWLVLGTAAPICINEEEDEPYPFNLELFQEGAAPRVPNDTVAVRIGAAWDDTDWIGDEVYPAWRAPDGAWRVGQSIPSGGELEVPVDPDEGWRLDAWLCLTRDSIDATPLGDYTPGAFVGDIDVELDLILRG